MIDLVSVNVGQPEEIGIRRGRPVLSSIRKHPVASASVEVSLTNIAGDAQADLRVHGGPDKAIFAYPIEHLQAWSDEFRPSDPFLPGSIGDNFTVRGLEESNVRIGDIWQWGDVLLQVCQPRFPCFKLALAVGSPKVVKRFMETGRSGWYIRVLEPGAAPVGGPIHLQTVDSAGVTVREAAMAVFGNADDALRMHIAMHPALAASWRRHLLQLAGQTG